MCTLMPAIWVRRWRRLITKTAKMIKMAWVFSRFNQHWQLVEVNQIYQLRLFCNLIVTIAIRKSPLNGRLAWNYSETGCSFARHFAILSRNVGILIGSLQSNCSSSEQLLRASCDSNFNLLPEQTVFHIGMLWVDCDGKQQLRFGVVFTTEVSSKKWTVERSTPDIYTI